ncbi:phosphotransferase [Nonomuraea indica]|uniref:Phosphotransferase n=1 Tax=Nonomuraea indica TaxID=1581193 RepID=A0ABW8ADR4_9ACTN
MTRPQADVIDPKTHISADETRIGWEQLPDSVRDAVQQHIAPVIKAETVPGGIMPGAAARLHLDGRLSVFLKAIRADSSAAELHRREQQANKVLPPLIPAPEMLWDGTVDGWLVTVFEFINDNSRHVDLSPGSPDLPAVVETVNVLGRLLTPCPPALPSMIENISPLMSKARHMLDKPAGELPDKEMFEAAVDGFDAGMLRGHTMVHYDLSAGNMLAAHGSIYVLDWSFAARGAAWVDAAMLAPRLIEAGHTPEGAEDLLHDVAVWRSARPTAVTGLAALWTLFRIYKAAHGPQEQRESRARAAEAGRAWVAHRLAA